MTPKYTAYFEASSQQELYDAIVASVGEAIQGRMMKAPAIVTTPAPTVARQVAPEPETPIHGPKKRGRKPGQKMGHYKKKDGAHDPETESEDENEITPEPINDDGDGNQDGEEIDAQPASPAPQVAAPVKQAATVKIASLDDTVQALKLVNSTFNVDKARECLTHFGVKRCGDLTEPQRGQFISYCEQLCVGR